MTDFKNMTPQELKQYRDREVMRIKLLDKLEAIKKFKHRLSAENYERREKEILDALEKLNPTN